ncbi:MAG: RidA family protein [Deltaproteobacteria bacterium]|nr:RidA family protein [Deltaproteobacteria bacterium]
MRQIVKTDQAPAAIGPYSQAVISGDWVICSGQVALDPKTGRLVEGDVAAQAEQALDNLMAVLEAAGSGAGQVVRCTVYLVEMNDFAAVNAVYARYFAEDPPARACVAVSALPAGARVEIDAMALRSGR